MKYKGVEVTVLPPEVAPQRWTARAPHADLTNEAVTGRPMTLKIDTEAGGDMWYDEHLPGQGSLPTDTLKRYLTHWATTNRKKQEREREL